MTSIKIIFQDDQLMVIDKPAGLVVDSSESQKSGTLQEILETEFGISLDRGGIVHRLDKDTSGLMVIAKTQVALDNLQAQFKDRVVKKIYLALAHGHLDQEKTVKGAIGRNPGDREKFTVLDDGGKEAETKFVPKERLRFTDDRLQEIFGGFNKIQMRKLSTTYYSLYTLLECYPLTGRTHQIRVHLKYAGFPLVGDKKYAGRKISRLDARWCPRQFLHATKLEFNHPATGEKLSFESPLPADLEQALQCLTPSLSNSP